MRRVARVLATILTAAHSGAAASSSVPPAGFQRSVTVYGVYVARSWTRSMPGSTVMITVDVPVAVVTVSRYTPGSTSNRKDPVTSVVDVPANSCVTALNSCTVVSGDGCPLLVTVPLTGSAHFQMF